MIRWIGRIVVALALTLSGAALVPGANAQPAHRVSVVELEIAPEHLAKFLEALRTNGSETIKEPGCLRYDVVQSTTNPNHIFIVEVYVDEAAVAAHRASPHFKAYQDATKGMVVKRQSNPTVSVASFTK